MPHPFATLAAAPHRVLFLPGALQAVLVMPWWVLVLEGRWGPTALPASAAHAWLMLYGLFPFFVFGFLFTALPSWLNAPKIERRDYLAAGLLMAAGAGLFHAGLVVPGLAALALVLHAAGWGVALAALVRATLRAAPQDKRHAWAALMACALGWLGDAVWLAWLAADWGWGLGLSTQLGLWGFLTPIFLTVCHRMIPWFTSRVVAPYALYRPYGLLWAMLLACLAHGLLEVAGLGVWTWLADLPLAALAFRFAGRWGLKRSLNVRLLAMLHIAFLWAGLAFALYALASLALLLGLGWTPRMAALHALGIGFFGSMLIGMASRVSLGHSGRKLEADRLTWALFWVAQLAALARMLPDLLPDQFPHRLASLAALIWLLAFGTWAWKYAPFYWRARIDGQAG